MLKKRFWGFYIDCEDCPNFFSYDNSYPFKMDALYLAIEIIKSKGWEIRKNYQGIWEHYCPECALKRMM